MRSIYACALPTCVVAGALHVRFLFAHKSTLKIRLLAAAVDRQQCWWRNLRQAQCPQHMLRVWENNVMEERLEGCSAVKTFWNNTACQFDNVKISTSSSYKQRPQIRKTHTENQDDIKTPWIKSKSLCHIAINTNAAVCKGFRCSGLLIHSW